MRRFVIITLAIVCACNTPSGKRNMNWLQGKWINITDEGSTCEIWTRQSDSVLTGISYTLGKKGDTLFLEHLTLEQHGSNACYIPTVSNQNDGKPVPFNMIAYTDSSLLFENKEHDFPQRIGYLHANNDSIYAWIEGNNKGKYSKIGFPMRREQ